MPYIEIKTTEKILPEQKEKLAGQLAEVFGEVSDAYVAGNIQFVIQDECWLRFRGSSDQPSAHVFIGPGPMTPVEDYSKIVSAFFSVITKALPIPQNRIYVNVRQIDYWGYDGRLL